MGTFERGQAAPATAKCIAGGSRSGKDTIAPRGEGNLLRQVGISGVVVILKIEVLLDRPVAAKGKCQE